MLVLTPVLNGVGENLGDRLGLWLYDRMLRASTAPAGIAHLESPDVVDELAIARDFDLGLSGPPLSLSLGIIGNGLVMLATGIGQTMLLFGFSWWAPLLLGGAWASTHVLLKESTVWDRSEGEVRAAQRQAEYAYRLAVAAPAAREVRIFGLPDWLIARFAANRRHLVSLRLRQTRLRQRPLGWALAILIAANGLTVWAIAHGAVTGQLSTAQVVVFAQAVVGASLIGFGGINWALPIAADSVATIMRLDKSMGDAGYLEPGTASADGLPAAQIVFRDVSFSYAGRSRPVLDHLDLTIPAGTSLAVVGLNGAGKTTLIKLLCRLYDPDTGTIEVDGQDLRTFDIESWRSRMAAVFQDFARYELPLRDNVAPLGAPDDVVAASLAAADADDLGDLDTVVARGYPGGIELSGGQWQRVALARALCAVRMGAYVVVLDEPTAQLDIRAEAAFFDRFLAAAQGRTTVLISHRFATVRHADQICVLDGGRITELGSHGELMQRKGRYAELFELQASRYLTEEFHA
ncbi:MAG TPA: ATP-binding cassette domain-containing protein [Streptosporangiaceae bacterium]|nr:ATP-binding cassette domain-containing protein [Streptosporangiaceae bacterium]